MRVSLLLIHCIAVQSMAMTPATLTHCPLSNLVVSVSSLWEFRYAAAGTNSYITLISKNGT